MTDELPKPRWRFFGRSEIWREGGTATSDFYLFGIRVWRSNFFHSTWLD